jgi:2-haloalkanoic acid dehalogenase type II
VAFPQSLHYRAVLFDLLSALLDSWTLWNSIAGSEAAGRRWRAAYLELTYGCGRYEPYESIVARAARESGLPVGCAERLAARWDELEPWSGADALLAALAATHKLGVVTNCSEALGRAAARRLQTPFDVIVTAESAGYYKPHPAPYQRALAELGLPPQRVLFVAGSGFDLIGTSRVGLDTYWHNRVGLKPPAEAPIPLTHSSTLDGVLRLAMRKIEA